MSFSTMQLRIGKVVVLGMAMVVVSAATTAGCSKASDCSSGFLCDSGVCHRHKEWQRLYPLDPQANATCADGSPVVVYLQQNHPEKWLVYFEGGGFCETDSDSEEEIVNHCLQQQKAFPIGYSSIHEPMVITDAEPFMPLGTFTDEKNNPFADYSKMYVAYCTQDLWLGTKKVSNKANDTLLFHGHHVAREALAWLNRSKLLRNGTLVLQGLSAGGFAVMNQLNWAKDNIQHKELKGIIDSSWFIDLDSSTGHLVKAAKVMSDNPVCQHMWGGWPCCIQLTCLALSYDFPAAGIDLFLLSHKYDPYLLKALGNKDPVRNVRDLLRYGEQMSSVTSEVQFAWSSRQSSVTLFFTDCVMHAGFFTSSRGIKTIVPCINQEMKLGETVVDVTCDEIVYPRDLSMQVTAREFGISLTLQSLGRTLFDELKAGGVSLRSALTQWHNGTGSRLHVNEKGTSFQTGGCPLDVKPMMTGKSYAELWRVSRYAFGVFLGVLWLLTFALLVFAQQHRRKLAQLNQFIASMKGEPAKIDEELATATDDSSDLKFRDVSWWVSKKKGPQILFDITGKARPGRVLAIMGGSGSGKTSLLEIIGIRRTFGMFTGFVMYNGIILHTAARIRAYMYGMKYVSQYGTPLMSDRLTALECLYFHSLTHMPSATTMQRFHRIRVLLACTDLDDRTSVPVLMLSGGQQRRLLVAFKLISNPTVLILDEPTSGLDSFSALTLVRMMHTLATECNKVVVMTIHQPSNEAFQFIDDLLLLRLGRLVWCGPRQDAVDALLPNFDNTANLNMAEELIKSIEDGNSLESPMVATHSQSRKAERGSEGAWVPQGEGDEQKNAAKKTTSDINLFMASSAGQVTTLASMRLLRVTYFELALLFVVQPVAMMFYCGFPNMDNTSASQFVFTVNVLSSFPAMMLCPVFGNEMCAERLAPFMYEMQSQSWKGSAFLVHWLLTDLSLITMSSAIGALAALALGYTQFLDAEGIASFTLISIAYTCVLACFQFTTFTVVVAITNPKRNETGPSTIGSLLTVALAATGALFNGFVYEAQSTFYQVLGYLCPGFWLGNSNVLLALQDLKMCAGDTACVAMDTILMHMNDRAASDMLPGFALVYAGGTVLFFMLVSAVAFKGRRFHSLHLFKRYAVHVSKTHARSSPHDETTGPVSAPTASSTIGDPVASPGSLPDELQIAHVQII